MDSDAFLDIPYVQLSDRDTFRELDIYLPKGAGNSVPSPLIVFVHGGAWRSEDKADHGTLARRLVAATNYPVAVPNYRLTPRDPSPDGNHFRHPGHSEDTLEALRFLSTWDGPRPGAYDPNSMYLIGHSCSAHMLMSILMDSSSITPSLKPSSSLVKAIKGIIMSEGIYDLDLLLAKFPKYQEWFIGAAFGPQDSLRKFAVTNLTPLSEDIHWLIIHSKGDTLIDLSQSEAVTKHLQKVTKGQVVTNFDQLTEEHDAILGTEGYINIVRDFILQEQ